MKIKGLALHFEHVLGSKLTYLSNVSYIGSTGTLFRDPGLNHYFLNSFNELQHLTASCTCSHVLSAKYVTELRG